MKGVVKHNKCDSNIGVELFNKTNESSSYGLFWFKPSELILCEYNNNEKEDENMITGDFKVAVVKFVDGTNTNLEYEYALFDDFNVGDACVVKSVNHGYGVARITNIIEKDNATTKNFEREIVDRFDLHKYEIRKENRAKARKLKAEMDKKMKELQDIALYQMMAEKSPELQEMLDEYKKLI